MVHQSINIKGVVLLFSRPHLISILLKKHRKSKQSPLERFLIEFYMQ